MGQDLAERTPTGEEIRLQMQWAKLAAEGDIIPADYKGKPANILVAIGFGSAMGLSFADSLYRINVIKGKPTMSAELIASQVRKAGHKLRIYKDPERVSVKAVIIRRDDPEFEFSAVRDQEWAEQMGMFAQKGDNYRKQPMTMLTWRAITAVAREACPEALYGAGYTPDELDDIPAVPVREETADVVVDPAPSKEQCRAISGALRRCGVTRKDDAAMVLQRLTGRDGVKRTDDLTLVEAEDFLSSPDVLEQRIRQCLPQEAPEETARQGGDGQEAQDDASR